MDLAANEAIFTSRREGLSQDTLRLWHGPRCVILGSPVSYEDGIDSKTCRNRGIEIVRAISVTCEVLFQDAGSLNFALATNAASFAKEDQSVLSQYQVINECIAKGLRRLSADTSADPYGAYINKRKVSVALPKWFYDFLLFQGTLRVQTDLSLYDQVIRIGSNTKGKEALTSLNFELGRKIEIDKVKETLVQGFEEVLGVRFENKGLTKDEQRLTEKLYRVKYSLYKWNVNGQEPFLAGMGKTAVEVFVAYPPTSRCRELVRLVNEVASGMRDEVKVTIWMRGRGISQHGPNPAMSSALVNAEKASIIPSIIVNGELLFQQSVPSKKALKEAIVNAI